jgi:hypothetical protein
MRTPMKTRAMIGVGFVLVISLLTVARAHLPGIGNLRGDALRVRPTIFKTDSAELLPTFVSGLRSDSARFDLRHNNNNSGPRRLGECSTSRGSSASWVLVLAQRIRGKTQRPTRCQHWATM